MPVGESVDPNAITPIAEKTRMQNPKFTFADLGYSESSIEILKNIANTRPFQGFAASLPAKHVFAKSEAKGATDTPPATDEGTTKENS